MKSSSQVAILLSLCIGLAQDANAQDNYDGAIWRFTLEAPNGFVKMGLFRVSDHNLYQKVSSDDYGFSRHIGYNNPDGRSTTFSVQGMRVFNTDGQFLHKCHGNAHMRFNRFGNWSGIFIDARGRGWKFNVIRIRE